MLADDHVLPRRSLRQLLDGAPGLRVVADGRAAVRLARDLTPHVVLMDVVLPELSRLEATRRIVAEMPAVRVLAV